MRQTNILERIRMVFAKGFNRLAAVRTIRRKISVPFGPDEAPAGFPGRAQEHMMFCVSPGFLADKLANSTAFLGGTPDSTVMAEL